MKSKSKWQFGLVLFLGISALVGVGLIFASKDSPVRYLKSLLPSESEIKEIYSEDLSVNGDYLVAAKISISAEGFEGIVKKLNAQLKAYTEINPMIETSSIDWWERPEQSNYVFFKSGERFQVWMFYSNGYLFYCDRGW